MAAIVGNILVPSLYEAAGRALNVGKSFPELPEDPLAVLDNINGTEVKHWIRSIPQKCTTESGLNLLKGAWPAVKRFPGDFLTALNSHQESIALAGALGGCYYIADTSLQNIPLINRTNRYVRSFFAMGLSAAAVVAGHHLLDVECNYTELAKLGCRVGVVAAGSTLLFGTAAKVCRFAASSSKVIAEVTTVGCNGIANACELLTWPKAPQVDRPKTADVKREPQTPPPSSSATAYSSTTSASGLGSPTENAADSDDES